MTMNNTMDIMRRYLANTRYVMYFALGITLFSCANSQAEDLRKVFDLSGYWKFSIGDDAEWSDPKFNDSDWDQIRVPDRWENQGYNEYNGYAWYRKAFTIVDLPKDEPIYFVTGRIDDADEIYLNGKLIGKSGEFPPNFETAANQKRKYLIPQEYLNFSGSNIIAVKVYDTYLEGGIIDSPAGIFVDEDFSYLDLVLSGKWKFHLGDNKQWASGNFDDESWNEINVPSEWENEGYRDYDGYAWYRTTFKIPQQLKDEVLYLSLGKIDDYDYVYINGECIGEVFDLKKDGEYKRKGFEYNARRVYKIPSGIIKSTGINSIAIRVYDKVLRGGIYEGPIGIMTEKNYKKYTHKHYQNQDFWDFIIDGWVD
jgi:sialate O-acetylesterase